MTALANPIAGVECQQNVIAPIHAHASPFDVVQDVIDEFYVVGLIMEPGIMHKLKACTLTGGEATGSTIEVDVPFNTKISRPPFEVMTPITSVVDGVGAEVPVLYRHKIYGIVPGSGDVT